MKKRVRRIHEDESAQVLVMVALLAFMLIGLMGLATDIGRIYIARSELSRSVDAAALAGAKQLPNITLADSKARAYISENEPNAVVAVEVYPDVPSQQVEVRATKTVDTIFMRVLGIGTVNVKNSATAGFGIVPVDAVMAIDATGSMDDGCDAQQDNPGCPIHEAKQAAISFTNTLLPGNNTVVGNISYRGCFNPPRNQSICVPTSTFGALTNSASTLITKINQMTAQGGSGTNNCGALDKAAEILFGTGSHTASNTIRNLILLTDGDNTYNNISNQSSPVSPDPDCRPTSPGTSDPFVGTGCSASGQGSASSSNPGSNSTAQERQLDTMTKNRADQLKALGVQIYVVGFGTCGSDDGTIASSTYCAGIGGTNPDTVMDQKLNKCIASSTPGTNDHYFRATSATQLPTIFQQIAQQIAFRLIK